MYNPLKPHIVEFVSTGFAVRRLTLMGWRYLDNHKYVHKNEPSFWWYGVSGESCRYWFHESLLDAQQTLAKYTHQDGFSTEVKKVYPC